MNLCERTEIVNPCRCALSATYTQHPLTPLFITETTTVIRLSVLQSRRARGSNERKAEMAGAATERLMHRMLIFCAAAICPTLLVGCATSGPTGGEILTGAIPTQSARLVIYRSSALGVAVQPDYVVDGKTIASSQPNGFVLCDLPPGRHEVSVSNLPFSNNFFGDGAENMTINLRPGIGTYIAATPQMGVFTPGKITLKEVSETQGRADTASLHQISAACG
jgi:hypothetical protein